MPAVNLPLEHTRSNVTLTPALSGQRWLLFHIGIATVALLSVFALRLALRIRRDDQARKRVAGLADQRQLGQNQDFLGIWEKSRGVSSDSTTAMSANQKPVSSRLQVDVEPEQRHIGGSTGWLQGGLDGLHDGIPVASEKDTTIRQHLKSRPPPPPPLTPPVLTVKVLTFEERRLSTAMSTMGELDSSFFQQPNPDYTSSSSSSSSSAMPQHSGSPITPRRRSYTKVLPLGPPQPVSFLEMDGSVTPFAPSSFPSSSPILPLAPHDSFHHPKEIDVKGEIISVMDDSGAGWKRHTRVYGGGVCLACLASDGEGGFYGHRVRPEEKR
ncbi:hypothetical protein BJ170DRAFT_590981 [Xylariales sp. AK1849]|nr:hypothetical protein BJ170DRAFT_590981 [Xylariales sp. AK1849]